MKKQILFLLFTGIILSSCGIERKSNELIIAVSKSSGSENYEQYNKWLGELCPEAKLVNLYEMKLEEAEAVMKKADALVLSGGPDVHPGRYGREQDTAKCYIDAWRDTLEFMAADIALTDKMPILGICRGEQLLNVHLGGELIVDIPEEINSELHQIPDSYTLEHRVNLVTGTRFSKLIGKRNGFVNSNHHQAASVLPHQLVPCAYADDDIIEAYEWRNPEDKSFLIAVQWHPERLGKDNPLSQKIGEKFIEEVKLFNSKQ
jgi:putative glutamine amidotransferase